MQKLYSKVTTAVSKANKNLIGHVSDPDYLIVSLIITVLLFKNLTVRAMLSRNFNFFLFFSYVSNYEKHNLKFKPVEDL